MTLEATALDQPLPITTSTRLKRTLMGLMSDTTFLSLGHHVGTHPAKSD